MLLAVGGMLYEFAIPLVQPLPVYMALPNASLTDQDGRPYALAQTRGKVVLLSPIYTHCADICPLTTAKMKEIQERMQAAGMSDQVRLVTFSVDPERDNPAVMNQFAGIYSADLSNWVFLTGTPDQIQVLIKGLSLYVERVYYVNGTPVAETAHLRSDANAYYLVNHTDSLFLIDRQGNVRALPPGSRTNVDDVMPLIQSLVRQ